MIPDANDIIVCQHLEWGKHWLCEIYLFNDTEPREIGLVGTFAGKLQSGVKERARGREKRGRDGVLLRKGFGIRHKFDSLSNFSEFRDG